MINIKHHFISILLFLYFSASYLEVTHIHNDVAEHHDNCSICIIVQTSIGIDKNHSSIDSLFFGIYETITSTQTTISTILLKGFDAHAPPA